MPLRPATFTPYPPIDKRAAARERYIRAIEEARKAKEEYADTLSDEEKKPGDGSSQRPSKPVETRPSPSPAAAAPTPEPVAAPAEEHTDEPMSVDSPPPRTEGRSTPSGDSIATNSPLPEIKQATPAVDLAPLPAAPAPASPLPNVVPPSTRSNPPHKVCAFTAWLKASMGVPSVFAAAPPATTCPADSSHKRIETTMPAPLPAPKSSEKDSVNADECTSRRRAALSVAALSSDDKDSKPSPSRSFPPTSVFSQRRDRDSSEYPAPPPPYRSASPAGSTSSVHRLSPVYQDDERPTLPPLRMLEEQQRERERERERDYRQPREDWDASYRDRMPARFSQAPPPPPPRPSSHGNASSHISLLAAAAASVEASSASQPSSSLKRHERDWDRDGRDRFGPSERHRSPASPADRDFHHRDDHHHASSSRAYAPPRHHQQAPPPPPRLPAFLTVGAGESVMPAPIDDDEDMDQDSTVDGMQVDSPRHPPAAVSSSDAHQPRTTRPGSAPLSSVTRPGPVPAASSPVVPTRGKATPKPSTRTPLPQLPQLPLPAPKPRPPSPTPQRIPLFVCDGSTPCPKKEGDEAALPEDPTDPLNEIARLDSTLEGLKKAFTFPNADALDFDAVSWPANFSLTAPPAGTPEDAQAKIRLPVCARNLIVYAYDHALQKVLTRLDGVGSARVRGVRDARKKVVQAVRDELASLDAKVQNAAREWASKHPEVLVPSSA